MPYAFSYDVPADEHFYRRVATEIGEEKPDGLVMHMVVKQDHGLRHIEVWESKEDWDRFCAQRLEPALDKAFADAGLAQRPLRPPDQPMDLVDLRLGV